MSKKEQNFCHHVKASGNLCQALPLRDEDYCYFHMLTRERLRRRRQADRRKQPLQIAIVENSADVQLAITDVANAVLSGALDASRGRLVHNVLQTALKNCIGLERFEGEHSYFIGFNPEQLHDGTEPDEDEDEDEGTPAKLEPLSAEPAAEPAAS
jgi:hypothetical protein